MSATEELRLEASVVDKFSAPLSRLRSALSGVKSPAALSGAARDFDRLNATVARSTEAIRTGYTSALAGLGIQSIAAAGAIAGLTMAITRFASSASDLEALSRETGLAARNFQLLQGVASQFGSSSEVVGAGLQTFARHLYDVKRGTSELIPLLLNADPTGKLLSDIKNPDRDKALNDTLRNLAEVGKTAPESARRLSEAIFGTGDFAKMTADLERFKKALADAGARTPILTKEDIERAHAFDDAVGKLKQSLGALATTVGTELAPPLAKAIELIDKMVKESRGDFAKNLASGVKEFGDALKKIDWETISKSFGNLGEHMSDIVRLMKILNLLGEGKAGEAWKEFKDMGARSAAPAAIKSARDEVEAAKKKLAEFDAKNGDIATGPGGRNMLAGRRRTLEDGISSSEEKLRRAIEEGARLGIKDGMQELLQRQSYSGGGFGGMIHPASFGGGGVGGGLAGGGGYRGRGGIGPLSGDGAAAAVSPGGDAARKGMIDSGAISPFKSGSKFSQKAPEVMRRLMADFGLTKDQAGGIVGNLGHESAGFKQMQEGNPLAGRGGWGWAQWTGPRRRAFEAWAKERGLDPKSDEANYGFLKHELQTSERGSLAAVRKQSTLMGSMQAFEGSFERSGIKNWASRRRYTEQAMGAFNASGGESAGASQSPRLPGLWRDKVTSGAAFGAARESGTFGFAGPTPRSGSASLAVTITSEGKLKSHADGGELFNRVDVNPGRTIADGGQ